MAVNLSSADKALKTLYLDVVSEQLNNNVNPLLARFKQSTNDVWGKEVIKLCTHGINGGIGAGTEDGNLPTATGNNYERFVTTLKNLYGTIEISDKAIRASENNSGAFVNLLNAEMEGLIKASSFNFGRMLFGNGSGVLANIVSVDGNTVTVDSVKNLIEGMVIDIREVGGEEFSTGRRITSIDRDSKIVTFAGGTISANTNSVLSVQGSFMNEITGLGKILDENDSFLYGLDKIQNGWLKPYVNNVNGEITESKIQKALDTIEERSGSSVNFIVCSWGVRRALINLFAKNKRIVDVMNLEGGFKALSYNGIPIVADRFCPEGTMYLLNTDDFTLHQLCDWQWLTGDDGSILKQVPGKPVYTATLVKYADLICDRPYGQGKLTGITEE
ncbi:MAG: phage major capsid protein [Clostridia bacterium]|nr:phage major capsid protein [Clostridia bacterium]